MKLLYSICLLLILLGFGACKKLADLSPMAQYTDKTVWSSKTDVTAAINGCYSNWETGGDNDFPLLFRDCLTDNAVYRNTFQGLYESFAAGNYNPALTTANDPNYNYTTINRCNWFLEHIDGVSSSVVDDNFKKRTKAEARFIRAYRYFILSQLYRNVPLVLHTQTIEESRLQKQSSKAVITDTILNELGAIAPDLPVAYADFSDKGRITRGAALALKARIELYNKKYDACIATCSQLMTAPFNYNLYPDFEGLFRPQFENSATNQEVILDVSFLLNYNRKTVLAALALSPAGNSTVAVTQSLVDAFETSNGKTIDQDAAYNPAQPYQNRDRRLDATVIRPGLFYNGITFDPITPPGGSGSIGGGDGGGGIIGGGDGGGSSGGGIIGGGDGGGSSGGGIIGGGDGGGSSGGGIIGGGSGGGPSNGYTLLPSNYKKDFLNSPTGYNFKKYLSVLGDYWNTPYGLNSLSNTGGNVIVIRYAEVLLTYAEAKIEAGQIDQSVYDAINKVRRRVNMPEVNAGTHSGQAAMRQLVRRERRVELAGEGLRWFDIVRWQIGPDVIKDVYDCPNGTIMPDPFNPFGAPVMTLQVGSNSVQFHRTFSPKYYVFPIPVKELQKNPNLVQNTEY